MLYVYYRFWFAEQLNICIQIDCTNIQARDSVWCQGIGFKVTNKD